MARKATPQNQYDLAIAGGGLAGGLLALALAEKRPELDIVLIEAEEKFGGNHIWSCFQTDIEDRHQWLLDPLISRHWDSYDVHFPEYSRSLGNGYFSIQSANLDKQLRKRLPKQAIRTGHRIKSVKNGVVKIKGNDDIAAQAVIDARGSGKITDLDYGWQKFFGQMLNLKSPHGLDRPVIMDATVNQIDGYRFFYCLPFGETELFVEDTYYSDSKDIDPDECRQRIADYCQDQGWDIGKVLHEELGQLPVIYGGKFKAFWKANPGPDARIGARAALIQPITSYTLPMAVRIANQIAETDDLSQDNLDTMLRDMAVRHWKEGKFYRMLCAFLFLGADPEKRYKTLQHTYTKDEDLLARFYAGKSTLADQANLLTGKPPIPISRAIPLLMKYR